MIKVSEFVSLGHPDKVADYISQYLLDRYVEKDMNVRYAVEVQIKDSFVTLGGEVSSSCQFTPEQITGFVREAVNEIGYTKEYQEQWGKENTICGDDLEVNILLSQQSRDIAKGLMGWGDQGIFFGYAEPNPETSYMPLDHTYAKRLCKRLFDERVGGLDIKTQVMMNGAVKEVVVAIPLLGIQSLNPIRDLVHDTIPGDYKLIINGTGRYVSHSSIADCGTTGRKLAVDFYGGNSRIGGGSPFTKDGSKADLSLNLFARWLAKGYAQEQGGLAIVNMSCCIGKQQVQVQVVTEDNKVVDETVLLIPPAELISKLNLDRPIYASLCRWGLFGEYQLDKAWEKL